MDWERFCLEELAFKMEVNSPETTIKQMLMMSPPPKKKNCKFWAMLYQQSIYFILDGKLSCPLENKESIRIMQSLKEYTCPLLSIRFRSRNSCELKKKSVYKEKK